MFRVASSPATDQSSLRCIVCLIRPLNIYLNKFSCFNRCFLSLPLEPGGRHVLDTMVHLLSQSLALLNKPIKGVDNGHPHLAENLSFLHCVYAKSCM